MQKKYKAFSNRLISIMRSRGHETLRSARGVCLKTLSACSGASEQICRRYLRGDALPDYDKIIKIAAYFEVSPGWLLFGESPEETKVVQQAISDELMRYILIQTMIYIQDPSVYADFVLRIFAEIRSINTTEENLQKIVTLALESVKIYANNKVPLRHNER